MKKHINAGLILAICFVAYVMYMSFASMPELLRIAAETIDIIADNEAPLSIKERIGVVNDEYEVMLGTEKTQPTLYDLASYIDLNGFMAKMLGQREMNDRVKLENGYLYAPVSGLDRKKEAELLLNLYRVCEEHDRDLLVALVPEKIYGNEDMLPRGSSDSTCKALDAMAETLAGNGVPILHFGERMQALGLTMEETYYKTDHHWKAETGWWAYTEIIKELTAMGSIPAIDGMYTDENSFVFDVYEGFFLGADGRRTGRCYAGVDDFTLIYPKFSTNISFTVDPDRSMKNPIVQNGEFYDAAFNFGNIMEEDHYNKSPYHVYGWGDRGLTHWRNASAPVDKKVLMIGDSFGNVPFAFLSLVFTTCDEMDFRQYVGDFPSYFETYDPDIVIIAGSSNTTEAYTYDGF